MTNRTHFVIKIVDWMKNIWCEDLFTINKTNKIDEHKKEISKHKNLD